MGGEEAVLLSLLLVAHRGFRLGFFLPLEIARATRSVSIDAGVLRWESERL